MNIKHLTAVMAMAVGLLVGVSTAHANVPLGVDCDLLAATNDAVNDYLDEAGVQFANPGNFLSSMILDADVFDQANALIEFFSDGEIVFSSATQLLATNARCGLLPQLIGNIRD